MKKTLLIFLLISVFFGCKTEEKKLFLVAGQSNAMGVGDSLISVYKSNRPCFEYNSLSNKYDTLKDPTGQNHLNFQTAKSGSFLPAFGYTYNEISNNKVYIVQCAKGGSSLTPQAEIKNWGNWSSTGSLFKSSVKKANQALKKINEENQDNSSNEKIKLSAILWSQGENDGQAVARNQISIQQYKTALRELIKKYQDTFGDSLPFIIIETGTHRDSLNNVGFKKVRLAQQDIANELENVFIGYSETASFQEKGWLKDPVHYNQTALNDIGTKLAYFYKNLEKK